MLRLIAEANEQRARDAEQERNNWSRVAADAAASATAAVLTALESRQRYETARRRRRSGSASVSQSPSREAKSSSVLQSSPSGPLNGSGSDVLHVETKSAPTAVPPSADKQTDSNSISTVLDNDASVSTTSRSVQSPKGSLIILPLFDLSIRALFVNFSADFVVGIDVYNFLGRGKGKRDLCIRLAVYAST